jgi:hypothetical protein
MVALAVDIGLLMIARTDVQRTADAAAHAGVLEYRASHDSSVAIANARLMSTAIAALNPVLNRNVSVSPNVANDSQGDIVVGRIDFDNPQNPMTWGDPDGYNAVRVRIRRTTGQNGEIPLFFAAILGRRSVPVEAVATAAIIKDVGGFRIPPSGENLPFLPLAISKEQWESLLSAEETDEWSWDDITQTIQAGPDEIPEVVLFPTSTGSAGNYGTVNIGTSTNSNSHLSTQIRDGVSQADLDFHGGELKLDSNGQLTLMGNPGIDASLEDDLLSVAGQPRVIPLYETVEGPGANAEFTIVKFVGVRIMAVELQGGAKFVTIQPANITLKGVIQSPQAGTSEQIYSPPVIVQ